MKWTDDKKLHYKRSFNWARTGLILGVWVILIFAIAGNFSWWVFLFPLTGAASVLLLGAGKELVYDKWMKQGCAEWNDMEANIIGAKDGLIGKKNKFK